MKNFEVFNATFSVCFISFHSILFRKIPIAIYKANVKQTGKFTVLQVHTADEVYIIEKNDSYLYHRIELPKKMKGNDQELVKSIFVCHSQHKQHKQERILMLKWHKIPNNTCGSPGIHHSQIDSRPASLKLTNNIVKDNFWFRAIFYKR